MFKTEVERSREEKKIKITIDGRTLEADLKRRTHFICIKIT